MTDTDHTHDPLAWAVAEMQRRRARAYADPITGSDVLFAKAVRLQAMGRQAEAEQIQAEAIARFEQIQRDYPMPPAADTGPERKPRTTLTMRQARLYLQHAGLLQQVDTLVSTLDESARIEWQYSTTVEMSSPIVTALAAQLQLSAEQVQAMFDDAALL